MDFEELASIVKFIAGIGVLVTLVYLATQLRQRNHLNQRGAQRPPGPMVGAGGFPPMNPGMPDDLARQLESLKLPEMPKTGESAPREERPAKNN